MEKLIAMILLIGSFNLWAYTGTMLGTGDGFISTAVNLNFDGLSNDTDGVMSVDVQGSGDMILDFYSLRNVLNIYPAVGGTLNLNLEREASVDKVLAGFDARLGGAFYKGDTVVALFGTAGIRSSREQSSTGSIVEKNGLETTLIEKYNYQVGGRFAFYIQFIGVHAQLVVLPMIDEYEFDAQLSVFLDRIGYSMGIAESFTISTNIDSSFDGTGYRGMVKLLFSKILVGSHYYQSGKVTLDYGAGIEWDSTDSSVNPYIFIGCTVRP